MRSAIEDVSNTLKESLSCPTSPNVSNALLRSKKQERKRSRRSFSMVVPRRVMLGFFTFVFHTILSSSFGVSAYVVGASDIDGGKTHGKILLDSIEYLSLLQPKDDIIRDILENEMPSLIHGLIDAQLGGGKLQFLSDNKKVNFGRNAFSHFYNPVTQEGYRAAKSKGYNRILERMGWLNYKFTQSLGPAMDSTEMIDWYYTKAVQLYRVNRTESVKALASAAHILQDATVPQHATDCGNENGDACRHYEYENLVNERYRTWGLFPQLPDSDNGESSKLFSDTDKENLSSFSDNIMSEEDIASFAAEQPPNEMVKFAARIAEGYMELARSPRLTDVRMVAGILIPFAQQMTATILLKFSQDVRKSDEEVSKRSEAVVLKITSVRMEGPLSGEKTAADFRPIVRYPNAKTSRTRGYIANKNSVDPLGGYDAFGWTFVQWIDGGVSTNNKEISDESPVVTFWLSIEDVNANHGCRRKCGSKRKNLFVGTGGRTEVDIRIALDQRASEEPEYSFTTGCDDTQLIQDGCKNTVRVEYVIGRSYLMTGSHQDDQSVHFADTVTGPGMVGFIFILILSFIVCVLGCFYGTKRGVQYYKERKNPKSIQSVDKSNNNEETMYNDDDPYGGMQHQISSRSLNFQEDVEYLNDEYLDDLDDGDGLMGGMIIGEPAAPPLPMDRRNNFTRRGSVGDLSNSGRGEGRGLSGDNYGEAMRGGSNHSGRRRSLGGSGLGSNHRRGSGSMGGSGRSLQRRGSSSSLIDDMGHPQRVMAVQGASSTPLYTRDQQRQGIGGDISQLNSRSFRLKRASQNGSMALGAAADQRRGDHNNNNSKRAMMKQQSLSSSSSSRRNLMENNNVTRMPSQLSMSSNGERNNITRMPSQLSMGSNGERKNHQSLLGNSHHSSRSSLGSGGQQKPGQAPMETIKTRRPSSSSNSAAPGRRPSIGTGRNNSSRRSMNSGAGGGNQTDTLKVKRKMSGTSPSPQPFPTEIGNVDEHPILYKSMPMHEPNSTNNKGGGGNLGKSLQKLSAEHSQQQQKQQQKGGVLKGMEITAQSVAGVSVLSSGGISTAQKNKGRPEVQPYPYNSVSPPTGTKTMPMPTMVRDPFSRSHTNNMSNSNSRRNLNQRLIDDEKQRPRKRLEQESIS